MSFAQLFKHEFRAILTNPAVVLSVFVGVIFYSFLYPQPYAKQIPRELGLVVANLDNSQMSRQLERMVDATPQIHIVKRVTTLAAAEEYFLQNRLAGILVIPDNFYRDTLLGRQPTLSYSGDASYFLVYGTIFEGLSSAGATLTARVKVNKMMLSGKPLPQALQEITPVELGVCPVFNSTGAYLNYILPAIFVLILHHTLIIGTGLLTGGQKGGHKKDAYWQQASVGQLLFVRGVAFGLIYIILSSYYFGFCLSYNEVPRLAGMGGLLMVGLPFILGPLFLGILLGRILPRPELVILVVILSSLPLIFASGFVWPVEELPVWLTFIVQFAPVIPAIDAFLKINQLGAGLHNIVDLLVHQWLLVGLYGAAAWFCIVKVQE